MAPLFGSPSVDELKEKRDTAKLIKALQHREPKVRAAAAKALGEIGDPLAVAPLIALLTDEPQNYQKKRAALAEFRGWSEADMALRDVLAAHMAVCIEAAESLGKLKDSRAVEPLIAAMNMTHFYVRSAAARALSEIGDSRAVEPLFKVYGLETGLERDRYARLFDKFDLQTDKSVRGAIYWIMKEGWDKCVEIGTPAVTPLISMLDNKDRNICKAAAETLVKIGDPQAVEPLIRTLKFYHDYGTRCLAAKALGQLGDAQVIEPLLKDLKEQTEQMRLAVAEALGNLGNAAVEPLLDLLANDVESVRTAAAVALEKLGISEPSSIGKAMAVLEDAYLVVRDEDLEKHVTESLDSITSTGEVGMRMLIKRLYRGMELTEYSYLDVAFTGDLAWNEWLKKRAIVNAFGRAHTRGVVPQLVSLLVADTDSAQFYEILQPAIARVLGEIGDTDAIGPLSQILKNEDIAQETRSAITEALEKLGSQGMNIQLE